MSGAWSRQEAKAELLTLAYQQVSFPRMNVVAKVAAASSIADNEARDRAFSALCEAVKAKDTPLIEGVLDLLTDPGLAVADDTVAVLPIGGAA